MLSLLTVPQLFLFGLLLVFVLGLAFFVARVARSGMGWSRQVQVFVGLGAIALAVGLVLHQMLVLSDPSPAVKSTVYAEKHWQKGTQGWANVAIGGGGYVTGIYLHPRQKDLVYLKTDIGGFYRWHPANQSWLPLTDQFPMEQHNYYGGEALALDPNDPNTVYIAAGKSLWEKGALFKSTNQGKTWTKLDLELPMGGNEDKRWVGERLAVNPFDSQVLLFGSRQDGLWRSSNAGKTWQRVKNFPAVLEKGVGIVSILFDPQRSGRVYVSAYGDGIYQSSDAGVTWRKFQGSPSKTNRMAFAADTLYVTSKSEPQVSKYANGTWRDITPVKAKAGFNALSINPSDPKQVIVAFGEVAKNKVYQSRDGGKNWTEQNRKLHRTVAWWKEDQFIQPAIAALEFDPHVAGRAWLTDWSGVWQTDAVTANPVVWTNYAKGHEELAAIALSAAPNGLLLSGVLDAGGFYHDQGLDQFPTRRLPMKGSERGLRSVNSIAYCEQDPRHVVLTGSLRDGGAPGATSRDGGLTWQQFANFPQDAAPSRVAMSASDPNRIVVTLRHDRPIHTADGSKTWKSVASLPKSGKEPRFVSDSLAADTVDGKAFYYYFDNEFYRSEDGGASFQEVSDSLPESAWHSVQALPGVKGEVWVGLDKDGLYRSTNGGETFTPIAGVDRAYLFAFGKPPPNSQTPALYLYGKVEGKAGIFRSLDRGKTWLNISSAQNPIGNRPIVMAASQQEFGLVFIGTNGRGIFYRHTGRMRDEG